MNIKEKIEKWIKETLNVEEVVLVHPKEIKNGDFSLIVNGGDAEKYAEALRQAQGDFISEIKFVAPRFINFFLSKQFFADATKQILDEKEKFGETELLKEQKIMVEFTDPNPFKEFHIGHLMSNAIGESISRVMEFNSGEIKRANWQGDVGIHVATAVWGIINQNIDIKNASVKDLGIAYAYGAVKSATEGKMGVVGESPEGTIKKEIVEINKHIFARDDNKINEIYDRGREISLNYFETIYKRLGTKFDHYFFESKEGLEGKGIVEAHLEDGIFEKSEGAIIFPGEKYGLHTRVFINSNGLPTYEAKELGLNKEKFEVESNLSKSIIVTGNEIKEYFKVLLKVISLIFPEIAKKTIHIPHGMLRLPEGKMSSRTGNIITAESLIEQVKEKIFEKIKDREFSDNERNEVAEIVAIGAIKYSILRQAIGGDIIFDFDKSLSFEGDSGPYLQYTYVRAKSVLGKAKADEMISSVGFADFSSKNTTSEIILPAPTIELERYLYRFPEVVERAAQEYAPHLIVTYITELASIFNSFYAKEKIISESDPTSPYKLALTSATATILKSGLHLLGIKVPERM